jgi:hypothetical protein
MVMLFETAHIGGECHLSNSSLIFVHQDTLVTKNQTLTPQPKKQHQRTDENFVWIAVVGDTW